MSSAAPGDGRAQPRARRRARGRAAPGRSPAARSADGRSGATGGAASAAAPWPPGPRRAAAPWPPGRPAPAGRAPARTLPFPPCPPLGDVLTASSPRLAPWRLTLSRPRAEPQRLHPAAKLRRTRRRSRTHPAGQGSPSPRWTSTRNNSSLLGREHYRKREFDKAEPLLRQVLERTTASPTCTTCSASSATRAATSRRPSTTSSARSPSTPPTPRPR